MAPREINNRSITSSITPGVLLEGTQGPIGNPEISSQIKEDLYGMRKVVKQILDSEMVNHPDHYQGNKFEVIDIIEDYELGFSLGNAIKYILRSDKKGARKQDLQKAIWYIQREINREDL
jgi:hypothetical protein